MLVPSQLLFLLHISTSHTTSNQSIPGVDPLTMHFIYSGVPLNDITGKHQHAILRPELKCQWSTQFPFPCLLLQEYHALRLIPRLLPWLYRLNFCSRYTRQALPVSKQPMSQSLKTSYTQQLRHWAVKQRAIKPEKAWFPHTPCFHRFETFLPIFWSQFNTANVNREGGYPNMH